MYFGHMVIEIVSTPHVLSCKKIGNYLRFAFLCPCFNYNINKEKLNGTDVDFNSKVTTFGH